MKQVVQHLRSGTTHVIEVPAPAVEADHLLINTSHSLISAGSERTLVQFGQANLLGKARSQPEKVQQVFDKIRTDGLLPTMEAVFAKLDLPMPLGYCNIGVVASIGANVEGFSIGDRVVSNGPHAEVVCVPQNLCARVPDDVDDETAVYTVLGAIALQGIRLAQPSIGESIAVMGMGVLGLLAVQILIANGCRVLAIDYDTERLSLAKKYGASTVNLNSGIDPVNFARAFSGGRGIDAVIIAAATDSDEPIHQAAQMSRKRGRIVLVGVVGLALSRADFYEKELSFQVSCSYGPGRYDNNYELHSQDYPIGFVRWTAKRNFEAILELMSSGKVVVSDLISHRIPQRKAADAYELLIEKPQLLGLVLTYPAVTTDTHSHRVQLAHHHPLLEPGYPRVGVIGAGDFSTAILLPALSKTSAEIKCIASNGGTSASLAARKFGVSQAVSDYRIILEDPEINAVFIATRHNSHAKMVVEALHAGKHVFVEKPLALNLGELNQIVQAVAEKPELHLMVGFNRRFSPLAKRMHELLSQRANPLTMTYLVNAGSIPDSHWIHDPKVGGGRIIGEACHFIDLMVYITGHAVVGVKAHMIGENNIGSPREDKMSILLEFEDGSIGTVHYFANGSKRFPKERFQVFSDGKILELDNFRQLTGYGWNNFRQSRLLRQDKGHNAEIRAFIDRAIEGGQPLIPWKDLESVSRATFVAVEQSATPLVKISQEREQ